MRLRKLIQARAMEATKPAPVIAVSPRPMKKLETSYLGQARTVEELDDLLAQGIRPQLPQIALVARSNAGKSSLVNSLLGTKLAIVSKVPGRTRVAHAYLSHAGFILIDLPGYGFAQGASEEEAETMSDIVASIALQRQETNLALLLVDSRRQGLMRSDQSMLGALQRTRSPFDVVFTKIDSLNKSETEGLKTKFAQQNVWFTSSRKHIGISELRKYLAGLNTPK